MLKVQSHLCFKDLPQCGEAPGRASSSFPAVLLPSGPFIKPGEPWGDSWRDVALHLEAAAAFHAWHHQPFSLWKGWCQ